MRKWKIIAGTEVFVGEGEVTEYYIVEARTYTVADNGIGGFHNENGSLSHSVPADKVIVIELFDDQGD